MSSPANRAVESESRRSSPFGGGGTKEDGNWVWGWGWEEEGEDAEGANESVKDRSAAFFWVWVLRWASEEVGGARAAAKSSEVKSIEDVEVDAFWRGPKSSSSALLLSWI